MQAQTTSPKVPFIAYKAFDRNLQCRGFQFKEGEVFEKQGVPELCSHGFHFCAEISLTLAYYPVDKITDNKYAEVEILGDVFFEEPTKHKGVTNKIRIVRVIPDEEIEERFDQKNNSGDHNSGNRNSGYYNSGNSNSGNSNSGNSNSGNSNSGNCNSGDRNSGNSNSGNYNSGDRNSGNRNSGYRNSGNRNSGDRNSGNYNSGYRNSGYRNSGNRNSGDRNSGDRNSGNYNSGNYNSGNYNSGFFNSITPKEIFVFNQPCLREVWDSAHKPDFLYCYIDPELGFKGSFLKAWKEADKDDRGRVADLPNFDAKVFLEITGINIEKD